MSGADGGRGVLRGVRRSAIVGVAALLGLAAPAQASLLQESAWLPALGKPVLLPAMDTDAYNGNLLIGGWFEGDSTVLEGNWSAEWPETDNVASEIHRLTSGGGPVAEWEITDQLEVVVDVAASATKSKQPGWSKPYGGVQSKYVYAVGIDSKLKSSVVKLDANGNVVKAWGAWKKGEGFFAAGVAEDPWTGDVWVGDKANQRIIRFDSSGNYEKSCGTKGSGLGQYLEITDVEVNAAGLVNVADAGNNRVLIVNGSTCKSAIGIGKGLFSDDGPADITIDNANRLYATDPGKDVVYRFTQYGALLNKWDMNHEPYALAATAYAGGTTSLYVAAPPMDSGWFTVKKYVIP